MSTFAHVLRNSAIAAVAVVGLGMASLVASPADAKVSGAGKQAVAQISEHFSGVPSMSGEFIQFGPNGGIIVETLHGLDRPGDVHRPAEVTKRQMNQRQVAAWSSISSQVAMGPYKWGESLLDFYDVFRRKALGLRAL